MNSEDYQQVFDTRLAEDSQARGRWTTTEGGSYFATGVGGALMGRGAHMFLIDDPFGSMADARSEPARKNVHDWFSANYSRLEKDGKIILINHRMHQDDLSGRLLAQQAAGSDQWTVVELKAVSSEGEALWPEKFDSEALARIKANVSAQDWAALYQQEPTAETGSYFKEDWLIPILDLPPRGIMRLWRVGLRRHVQRRRLYGACGDWHRSEAPDVSARPLETADLVQCVDRGMVRFGD